MRGSFHQVGAVAFILGALASAGSLAKSHRPTAVEAPKLGEAAPDFTLSNIQGQSVRLKDFHGKRNVALVFYPALFRAGG